MGISTCNSYVILKSNAIGRNIQGNAEDIDGSIEMVVISIDDGPLQIAEGTDSWIYEIDTGEFREGEISVSVRSYDGFDYSEPETMTIHVKKKDETGFIPAFTPTITLIGIIGIAAGIEVRRKLR